MEKITCDNWRESDLTEILRLKYEKVKLKFHEKFAQEPEFYARAPGRVNLIGEHIDYCGYSVFPMAIANDIFMAVSTNKTNQFNLTNVEESFGDVTIPAMGFEINKEQPEWYNYFLCGVKGIVEKFGLDAHHNQTPVGMNVCVYGTIPKSSGLSSSSALVVCAALVTMHANGLYLSKGQLANVCAWSERYIGTQGGGMDQAISCLANAGSAKLIDFDPFKVEDVTLPSGSLFVITNCCVEMNKAATNHFNTRVVECRLAAQILAKRKSLDWRKIKKLVDVQQALNATIHDMIRLTSELLSDGVYTKEEVCQILDVTNEELADTSLSSNTLVVDKFELKKRALHVFTEAQRVHDFKDTCMSDVDHDKLRKLGDLMNQSHESCKSLYDCSCPELDTLTDACRSAGAYGSRLTGAGWGGCAVSLIPETILYEFLDRIKSSFYSKSTDLALKFDSAAFTTLPSSGICLFKIDG